MHTPLECSADGCGRKRRALGFCIAHYHRFQRGQPMDAPIIKRRKKAERKCSIDSCSRPHKSKGFCGMHSYRAKNGLDMDAPLRNNRPSGVGQWHTSKDGYVYRSVRIDGKNRTEFQHRFVMEQYLGRALLREENIHHINGDRADNRIENLEIWNTKQPKGQRALDKLAWAYEIIALYGDDEDKPRGSSSRL